jgi:hypothetical protein
MIQPVSQIASTIEKRENVKISILKGGSGDLLDSIGFNQIGDLYLPGSESYIEQSIAEGLVSHAVHVGYNKAAMMVREGNPKSIPPSLDALKIDRSFVNDMTSDPADRELVNAAIAMAHGLGLKVIADGVETDEQLAHLAKQGCEMAQGYLFSEPVHADEITRMLEKQAQPQSDNLSEGSALN